MNVGAYLDRIGFTARPTLDLQTLAALQRHHMTAVPFENLHVFHRIPVRTDLDWSVSKIVEEGRGGWCFELNGAFGGLLAALGFDVTLLGAAVLLDGPSQIVDHLTLEVMLDQPYLVDVGFGDSTIRPLELNSDREQDGGSGTYQLMASPQGTTLARLDAGVPVAQFRFKRVALTLGDFDAASQALQDDPTSHFRAKPLATRLLDGGPDRVSLSSDRLRVTRDGETIETPVAPREWPSTLDEWFGLTVPTA